MTIYAIVNPLISDNTGHLVDNPLWMVMSPSSILQGGNPYFVPDFADTFEARPALALRIGKLGKGISPRFVARYIESVAPASLMIASDLLQSLQSAGLPWSEAISYDRSLALGKFIALPYGNIPTCTVAMNMHTPEKTDTLTWRPSELPFSIEDIISSISRDNALKTGDVIIAGIATTGLALRPGPQVELKLDNTQSLRFNIR